MPQADNSANDATVSEAPAVSEETATTSTNEETSETDVDFDFENDTTSFDDFVDDEETTEAESSETENQDTEPVDEEESEEDEEQSSEEERSDEESNGNDTTPEDVKRHNAEMAARRIAEKQAREAAKLQAEQAYLDNAEDDKDFALRQLQVEAYNNRVDRVTNALENGIERAVADIDLFRTGTPEVKEELVRRLEDFEAKHVLRARNGDAVGTTADVYEYLQKEADSIQRILATGARGEARAKVKAKARTETLPSRTPKESKVDPDLAEFDKVFGGLE